MKITEIPEKRFRTTHRRDRSGRLIRGREEYTTLRKVNTVDGGTRFGHFMADSFLIQLFYFISSMLLLPLLLFLQESENMLLAICVQLITICIYPFYYFIFESTRQQTPGKMLTKSIVIDQWGNKPTDKQILLRSLIRLVPFEAFSCLAEDGRGWHDRWTDTFVVSKKEHETLMVLIAAEKEKSEEAK